MSLISALALAAMTGCVTDSRPNQKQAAEILLLTENYASQLAICNNSDFFRRVTTAEINTPDFADEARSQNPEYMHRTAYYGGYYASDSLLKETDNTYLDPNAPWTTSVPEYATGLPSSLAGKNVHIRVQMPTKNPVYAIHLDGDAYESDKDYYKIRWGNTRLLSNVTAEAVSIIGPVDYCVTSTFGDNSCSERNGKITVVVKPDIFETKCAELKEELNDKIKNL